MLITPVNSSTITNNKYSNITMCARHNKTQASPNSPVSHKKHLSNTAKAGIALGALALAGGVIYFITTGKTSGFKLSKAEHKKLQELVTAGEIDEKSAKLFTDLYESEAFGNTKKMYDKLTNYMGYKIAPEVVVKKDDFHDGFAIYNFANAKIGVGEKCNMSDLYHELIHFSQFDKMYRRYGKDAIIDARIEGLVNELKFDSKFKGGEYTKNIFGKSFDEVTPEELEKFIAEKKATLNSHFNDEFYKKVAKSQGKLDKQGEEDASKYLEGLKSSDRNASSIERDAYKQQLKFEDMLRKFATILEK